MDLLAKEPAASERLQKKSRQLSRIASCAAAIFPMAAAVGWIFHVPVLLQVLPSLPVMQPSTAVALLLAAVADFRSCGRERDRVVFGIGGMLLLFGLACLSEYLFKWNLGFNRLLVPKLGPWTAPYPGRPAPQTAANFAFLGAALVLYGKTSTSRIGQACALLVAVNAIVAMTGYIFSTKEFYGFPAFHPAIGMALHTALSFILLAVGLVSSRPAVGMMMLLTSPTRSGAMARKIFLANLIAPPFIGIITKVGIIEGWYDSGVQAALFTVVLLGAILLGTWRAIRRSEREELRAKELYDERQIFAALIENSADFIGIADPHGRPVYVNPAGRRMVGLDEGFPIEKTRIPDYYPPGERAFAENVILREMLERGHWRGETVFRNWKSEAAIPVSDEHFMIRDAGTGRILGMGTVTRDITERKKSERALTELNQSLEIKVRQRTEQLQDEIRQRDESQRIYRAIGELIDYGIWICDPAGRNLYASESFLRLVGLTQKECSEFGWSKVLHPDEAERTIAAWKQTVRTGGTWDIQHRFMGVDGKWHPVLARGVPVRNEKGEIIYWAGINLDISALKESEAKFKVLAEAIPQLCWIARPDGFIFWYNQRWYAYTGTTPSEMEGWGWQSVHDPEILPVVLERWRKSIRTGAPFEMEFPLRGADGRFKWFLTRVLPLRDENDKIINWFGTNTDIEAQRRALREREELLKAIRSVNEQLEQRVQERTRDLQRSNRELEEFAYIASHDLQTPLRHVASYVQLLVTRLRKTTSVDSQIEKWINYILAGTQQMKSLITDLLTYSRVGRIDVAVEKVDLSQVIADVCHSLEESIRKSRAQINYGGLPAVIGVKSQLTQLFQNLMENSIKFRKPDVAPRIEIHCEDQGEAWKLSVTDNGIGFDPMYTEKIFTMFQRLHTTEEYKGTGIGLAICKKIVEFHGGTIGATSAEGQGSTFYFSIPKKERVSTKIAGVPLPAA